MTPIVLHSGKESLAQGPLCMDVMVAAMPQVDINGIPTVLTGTGYGVAQDGTIWSFLRSKGPSRGNGYVVDRDGQPRRLKPKDNGRGYLSVFLGKGTQRYIHRLVWEAWNGPIPEGMQVCHNDGDRSNNALNNLRIDTQKGNEADKRRHGTLMWGDSHPNSAFSEAVLDEVIRLHDSGMRVEAIVEKLGLKASRATVFYRMKRRRSGDFAGLAQV